ncbi:DEAD/DEAH box helicase [Escherichia coli]
MAVMYSVLRRQAPGQTAGVSAASVAAPARFPRKKSGPPRILILTPTRELAMQVADRLPRTGETYASGYRHHHRRRGLEPHGSVRENQDIVVATTGRLLQYIKEENFDCRAVETLILDEASRCAGYASRSGYRTYC